MIRLEVGRLSTTLKRFLSDINLQGNAPRSRANLNMSMEHYLRSVIPNVNPELINFQALSSIQSLAQKIPVCQTAGFECRLAFKQSRVDFQIKLPRLVLNLPDPAWQACRSIYQNWINSTSGLHHCVRDIGLEFDMVEQSSQTPIPCLFLSLSQDSSIGFQEVIEMALKLINHPISSSLHANLNLCAHALPDDARVAHIGLMLSRHAEGIRLIVKGISFQQLPDYLEQIGWGDTTKTLLPSLVSTTSEFVDSISLAFDVGSVIHPKIGLECFLDKQFHDEIRWQLFLDYLVEKDLCTSAKRDALLAWPGLTQKSDCPDLWPSNLMLGDIFFGSKAYSVFWRKINHIKLVYQPGKSLSAKAYIAFGHSWVSTDNFS